jgi:hypothetical protein
MTANRRWSRGLERWAFGLLIALDIGILAWAGFTLFRDPYLPQYNTGNAAYYVQVLHNLSQGLGPEQSVKAGGALYFHDSPYYFGSTFSIVPQFLPLAVLAPLYALHPFPPMHVFAMVIVVVLAGSCGMFLALRALGGTRTIAALGAAAYYLMPWVEKSVFFNGAYDNLAFAVYPFVFAGLFARRWALYHAGVVLLCLISLSYVYAAVALGIIVALFFQERRHGFITAAVALAFMGWDTLIVKQSLAAVWQGGEPPKGVFTAFLTMNGFRDLLAAMKFHSVYLATLLLSVALAPLFGLRRDGRWNLPLLGLLAFAGAGAFMGLFRSYDWASHRNANMVVPIYLGAFMVWLGYGRAPDSQGRRSAWRLGLLCACSMAAFILLGTEHYPWSGLRRLGKGRAHRESRALARRDAQRVWDKIQGSVPADAAVAFRIDAGLEAFIANRQKVWNVGYNPEGVEYYVIQTEPISFISRDYPAWEERLRKLESGKDFRLLYKDQGLVIYQNLKPAPIPRREDILGWDVLWRCLLPEEGKA